MQTVICTAMVTKNIFFQKVEKLEDPGIDRGTFRMLSGHSTI